MASKLDRALQKDILEKLSKNYPTPIYSLIETGQSQDEQFKIKANLLYLEAHGLIDSGLKLYGNYGEDHSDSGATITAKGLDFLADDGGLSAILGVVTVRLHDDTIRQMIEAKISQADLPPAEKKKWFEQLRSLPADSMKHLTMELISKGLEKAPELIPLLQKHMPF